MTEYIKREDAILAITRNHDEVLSVADAIKDLDEIPSADVVELEISPVCYKCDGKTAGVRTEKCLWLNGDNSKCIEQAHKLLYLAERKGMPSVDAVEIKKEGEWDMFDLISSAYYGKGMYFKQDNEIVYSRHSNKYMTVDEAIKEFISLINEENIAFVPSVTTTWADGEAPTYALQKHGKWIETKFSRFTYYKCSVCNASYECENAEFDFNFCPNCGADMRGEHDE